LRRCDHALSQPFDGILRAAFLLREMIGFAAGKLLALEVGTKTGAGDGEKSGLRLAQRHGQCDRDWQTRAGTARLRIPGRRTGSDFPSFPGFRRMTEKALTAVIQDADLQGVSTRSVDDPLIRLPAAS